MTGTEVTAKDRPAVRLDPDSRPVILLAVCTVGLLALTSFALGVPGLLAVAAWAQLPGPLRWAVPVLLDAGLVVFALQVTVQRARHESAVLAGSSVAILAPASMAAQVAHVMADGSGPRWQVATGAALAAAFPAVVFAASESLLSVAVAPPTRRRRNGGRTVAVPDASRVRPTAPVVGQESSAGSASERTPADVHQRALRTTAGRRLTDDEKLTAVLAVQALRARKVGWDAVKTQTGVAKSSAQRRAAELGVPLNSEEDAA